MWQINTALCFLVIIVNFKQSPRNKADSAIAGNFTSFINPCYGTGAPSTQSYDNCSGSIILRVNLLSLCVGCATILHCDELDLNILWHN